MGIKNQVYFMNWSSSSAKTMEEKEIFLIFIAPVSIPNFSLISLEKIENQISTELIIPLLV